MVRFCLIIEQGGGLPDILGFVADEAQFFPKLDSGASTKVEQQLSLQLVACLTSSKSETRSSAELALFKLLENCTLSFSSINKGAKALVPAHQRAIKSIIESLKPSNDEFGEKENVSKETPATRSFIKKPPIRVAIPSSTVPASRATTPGSKVPPTRGYTPNSKIPLKRGSSAKLERKRISVKEIVTPKALILSDACTVSTESCDDSSSVSYHPLGLGSLTLSSKQDRANKRGTWPEYPEEPGNDHLQSLKKLWSPLLPSISIRQLFPSKGIYNQEDSISGLKIIESAIKLAEENEDDDSIFEQMDLLCKWFSCALCSREHTTGNQAILNVLAIFFSIVRSRNYELKDYEANILLPYVLDKGSVSKGRFRDLFKDLICSILVKPPLYQDQKYGQLICISMLERSNTAKTRLLVLNEILSCVERVGITAIGKKGINVIIKCLTDEIVQENRNACLDVVEMVLVNINGDLKKLFKVCGKNMPEKTKKLIKDRWSKRHVEQHILQDESNKETDERCMIPVRVRVPRSRSDITPTRSSIFSGKDSVKKTSIRNNSTPKMNIDQSYKHSNTPVITHPSEKLGSVKRFSYRHVSASNQNTAQLHSNSSTPVRSLSFAQKEDCIKKRNSVNIPTLELNLEEVVSKIEHSNISGPYKFSYTLDNSQKLKKTDIGVIDNDTSSTEVKNEYLNSLSAKIPDNSQELKKTDIGVIDNDTSSKDARNEQLNSFSANIPSLQQTQGKTAATLRARLQKMRDKHRAKLSNSCCETDFSTNSNYCDESLPNTHNFDATTGSSNLVGNESHIKSLKDIYDVLDSALSLSIPLPENEPILTKAINGVTKVHSSLTKYLDINANESLFLDELRINVLENASSSVAVLTRFISFSFVCGEPSHTAGICVPLLSVALATLMIIFRDPDASLEVSQEAVAAIIKETSSRLLDPRLASSSTLEKSTSTQLVRAINKLAIQAAIGSNRKSSLAALIALQICLCEDTQKDLSNILYDFNSRLARVFSKLFVRVIKAEESCVGRSFEDKLDLKTLLASLDSMLSASYGLNPKEADVGNDRRKGVTITESCTNMAKALIASFLKSENGAKTIKSTCYELGINSSSFFISKVVESCETEVAGSNTDLAKSLNSLKENLSASRERQESLSVQACKQNTSKSSETGFASNSSSFRARLEAIKRERYQSPTFNT